MAENQFDFTLKLPSLTGKKGVAESIILILSKSWPLSVVEMRWRLENNFNKKVSFQGVHKAARKLLREGILCKEQSLYLLDSGWLEKLDKFSGETKIAYNRGH